MKRYTCLNVGLVLALLLGALLTWGLATGALAQCSGNSGYMHEQPVSSGQVGEPTGTYVWDQGSPAPGYPGYLTGSSYRMVSNPICEPIGTYVWDQGSPAPGHPCLSGFQNHCTVGTAACPGHPGHGSCG